MGCDVKALIYWGYCYPDGGGFRERFPWPVAEDADDAEEPDDRYRRLNPGRTLGGSPCFVSYVGCSDSPTPIVGITASKLVGGWDEPVAIPRLDESWDQRWERMRDWDAQLSLFLKEMGLAPPMKGKSIKPRWWLTASMSW